MSGFVGALVEAWDELRIHRLRVLLALIGVAAAVTAITGVTAAVAMLQQAFDEQADRANGRQVTLNVNAWSATGVPTADQNAALDAAYAEALDRYGLTWSTRDFQTGGSVRFPDGRYEVPLRAVDPAAGILQRISLSEGRWFATADAEAFAPTLVVNRAFLDRLGVGGVETHPTVLLGRDDPVRATVIGVMDEPWENPEPTAMILYDQRARWMGTDGSSAFGGGAPTLAVWVPPELADDLTARLRRDVAAAVPGMQVDIWDNRFTESFDIDGAARWVGIGVGGFALLLGGLGLVNIALVTVRYRIREIGIRRSFGATSGRVFFGVLMESVVATVVAGLVGVVLAVAIIKSIPVDRVFGGQIQEVPPFPVSAALVGMAAATGVGALAGLIPAIVAVRVKVIDAIRY
ncbi:ABC transporter permease [Cellulomonas endophytica]|uniref:ABC transporter permease n=1 Tax=Cellulomonas endophytica TaxID=2494735 RepID=UPI001012806A|nr:ABC transporter permease [Cellulomonas endophytica]